MPDSVQLKGVSRGYKRGAIFEVQNGKCWQQTSFHYQYRYAYRPSAQLEAFGSRGKMKIEGHSDWIEVKRVPKPE